MLFGFPAEFDYVVFCGCLSNYCAVYHLCEAVSCEFHFLFHRFVGSTVFVGSIPKVFVLLDYVLMVFILDL